MKDWDRRKVSLGGSRENSLGKVKHEPESKQENKGFLGDGNLKKKRSLACKKRQSGAEKMVVPRKRKWGAASHLKRKESQFTYRNRNSRREGV